MSFNQPDDTPEPRSSAWTWWSKNAQIVYGFVGWYLVNGLFWLLVGNPSFNSDYNFIRYWAVFPLNLLALIILALVKKTRIISLGMLAALALNLLVSLVVGASMNGMCFVPFYLE